MAKSMYKMHCFQELILKINCITNIIFHVNSRKMVYRFLGLKMGGRINKRLLGVNMKLNFLA